MNAAQLQTVEEIFHAALELEPSEVAAFLDGKCAGDEALRREVEALLAAHREAGNFIGAPVVRFDTGVFDDEPADRQYEKLVAIKLIKRGILTGEDEERPEEVAREIAQCNASLRRLA